MGLAVFYVLGALSILCALGMIAARKAVHSALFMVGNFVSVAALYIVLNAPFLAAVQVVIYAGAIVVLFLFVIMMLNVERAEGPLDRLAWQRPAAIMLALVLLALVGYVAATSVLTATNPNPVTAETIQKVGHTQLIGQLLFTDYLYPFEITSVLLLIAMVGAVVLAKRK